MSEGFADFARYHRHRAWLYLKDRDLKRAWQRWRTARLLDRLARRERKLMHEQH